MVLADDPAHGVPGLTDDPAVALRLLSATLATVRQVAGAGRVRRRRHRAARAPGVPTDTVHRRDRARVQRALHAGLTTTRAPGRATSTSRAHARHVGRVRTVVRLSAAALTAERAGARVHARG